MRETYQLHDLSMQESKAKIGFVQSKFMVLHALQCLIYAIERKEGKPLLLKQTLSSRFALSRAYKSRLTRQHFISN